MELDPATRSELRILVVDDYPECAAIVCDLLRRLGHDCVPALTGQAALALAEDRAFDIALLDLELPDVSGLELARRLSTRQPRPYLVALTGWTAWHCLTAANQAGFDQLVTKPVRRQQLVEVVHNAAQARELRG